MTSRKWYRAVFGAVLLFTAVLLLNGYVQYSETVPETVEGQMGKSLENRTPVDPATDATTVVLARPSGADERGTSLIALSPDGRPWYYDDSLQTYWDVEPSPKGKLTVVYAGRTVEEGQSINVIERVNLSTGATERVYQQPARGAWKTIDRVNETTLVVGDTRTGQVFILNVTSSTTGWEWGTDSYRSDISKKHDGKMLSDVAALDDGRFLLSVYWRDQSIFVDRTGNVQTEWALGKMMEHSVLFHPRDLEYVSAENGGPAVLAADYGNDRVVEFQRQNGEWKRSWVWNKWRLQQPNDIERLDDGRTLVANTGGDEVLFVSPDGTVTKRVDVINPVDVERLPDSSTGPSAAEANLVSKKRSVGIWNIPTGKVAKFGLSKIGLYGTFQRVLPYWIRRMDLLEVGLFVCSGFTWLATELWWEWGTVVTSMTEPRGLSDHD